MMTKYHISLQDGKVRKCTARSVEFCRADTINNEHYSTVEEAQQAYEKYMSDSGIGISSLHKSSISKSINNGNILHKLQKSGYNFAFVTDDDIKSDSYRMINEENQRLGFSGEDLEVRNVLEYHMAQQDMSNSADIMYGYYLLARTQHVNIETLKEKFRCL